jgi:hypothetical protein
MGDIKMSETKSCYNCSMVDHTYGPNGILTRLTCGNRAIAYHGRDITENCIPCYQWSPGEVVKSCITCRYESKTADKRICKHERRWLYHRDISNIQCCPYWELKETKMEQDNFNPEGTIEATLNGKSFNFVAKGVTSEQMLSFYLVLQEEISRTIHEGTGKTLTEALLARMFNTKPVDKE